MLAEPLESPVGGLAEILNCLFGFKLPHHDVRHEPRRGLDPRARIVKLIPGEEGNPIPLLRAVNRPKPDIPFGVVEHDPGASANAPSKSNDLGVPKDLVFSDVDVGILTCGRRPTSDAHRERRVIEWILLQNHDFLASLLGLGRMQEGLWQYCDNILE